MTIIAVDFDGTLAEHEYPEIGDEVPGAIEWLKTFQQAGAKLILWTMRSDSPENGPTLTQAVEWCRERGIEFYGVNSNPDQSSWTTSPKAYAQAYIDDAAIGCPLRESPRYGARVYVDWTVLGPMVIETLQLKSGEVQAI